MKLRHIGIIFLTFAILAACNNNLVVDSSNTGNPFKAQWARTVSAGVSNSAFNSVAIDAIGNVYTVGYQWGSDISYDPGVSAEGVGGSVLVKYNSNGEAQWARASSTGGTPRFHSVALDAADSVYVAGVLNYGISTFGPGVSIQGTDVNYDVLLVKYNSNGEAQWARTESTGYWSEFNSVAVDSTGNVYAAGFQMMSGIYTYGPGVSAQSGSGRSVVLVKYDSHGTAQWARTVSTVTSHSQFNSVVVDAAGNIYAAGLQSWHSHTYGPGVTTQNGVVNNNSAVLVKYNSNGEAQWARTVSSVGSSSEFKSLAIDAAGNIYAAGNQNGTDIYTYGPGVSTQGSGNTRNAVLVKYDSNGLEQWARTVSTGTDSWFNSVAIGATGDVYAAGSQHGNGLYTYGPGVDAQGSNTGSNIVLVKYNSNGTALLARTVSTGTGESQFNSVAIDSTDDVYAAGSQRGNDPYTYGPGVGTRGSSTDDNVLLVKYAR